jgi:hypothetical protein
MNRIQSQVNRIYLDRSCPSDYGIDLLYSDSRRLRSGVGSRPEDNKHGCHH